MCVSVEAPQVLIVIGKVFGEPVILYSWSVSYGMALRLVRSRYGCNFQEVYFLRAVKLLERFTRFVKLNSVLRYLFRTYRSRFEIATAYVRFVEWYRKPPIEKKA